MLKSQAISFGNASSRKRPTNLYDPVLISVSLFFVLMGLIMVASSSVSTAEILYSNPLYFFWRQLSSVVLGLFAALLIVNTPLFVWEKFSTYFIFIGFIFLVAVLIPGVGREVNGSMRWISIGNINIQSSEITKVCLILYLAGYMIRHEEKIRESFAGFIRPIIVVTLISGLLLLEPDYGSAVVLFATALGMMFMGGVPLSRFFIWVFTASISLISLAVISPYRLQRLTSFIDPWQDPFNTGFQLSQALIAFGRGDWFGVGLGSGIQKLFYLPEAHTDFVYAVLAEEFGLLGSILIIFLYFVMVWRAFLIGETAQRAGKLFSAYISYGVGLIIGIQAFINIGVNMGVLPTKGLTLPLISYGNNSIIISIILISFLVRIEMENRQPKKLTISERYSSDVS
jgi:cell division protein FtsW